MEELSAKSTFQIKMNLLKKPKPEEHYAFCSVFLALRFILAIHYVLLYGYTLIKPTLPLDALGDFLLFFSKIYIFFIGKANFT